MEDRALLSHEKLDLSFIFMAFFVVVIVLVIHAYNNFKDNKITGSKPSKPVTLSDPVNTNISNNPIDVSNTGYVPSVHQVDPSIPSTTTTSDNSILKVNPSTSSDIRQIIDTNLQANNDTIKFITKDFKGFIYPPKTPVGGSVYGSAYGNGKYSISITDPNISNSSALRLWSDDVNLKPFTSSHIFNDSTRIGMINADYRNMMVNQMTFYVGYEINITFPHDLIVTGIVFNGPDYKFMPDNFIVNGTFKTMGGYGSSMILYNTQGIKNNLVVYPVDERRSFNGITILINTIIASHDIMNTIDTLQLYSIKILGYPPNINKSSLTIKPYTASLFFST